MATIKTDGLSPMRRGRLQKALDALERRRGVVKTIAGWIEDGAGVKTETDGWIDYNRHTFNRMDGAQQREYEARLRAKRYRLVDGYAVPKIVFDAVEP